MQYKLSMTQTTTECASGPFDDSVRDLFTMMEQMMMKISDLEVGISDLEVGFKESKKEAHALRAYCKMLNREKICQKPKDYIIEESKDYDCSLSGMDLNTSIEALKKMNEFVNVDDSNTDELNEVTRQLELVLDDCKAFFELKTEDDTFCGDGNTDSTFVSTSFDDESVTEIYFDGDSLCLDDNDPHPDDDDIEGNFLSFCTRVDDSFLELLNDTVGYQERRSEMDYLAEGNAFIENQLLVEAIDQEKERNAVVRQDLDAEKMKRSRLEEELKKRRKEHANAPYTNCDDIQELMAKCQHAKVKMQAAEIDAQEALELALEALELGQEAADRQSELEEYLQHALDEVERLRDVVARREHSSGQQQDYFFECIDCSLELV